MGKMIRTEGNNVIRPRKSTVWALEPRKVPIFKTAEDDFTHDALSYNSYQAPKSPEHEAPSELKKSVLNQLEKYCENTTLHGLRYVGDPNLTFGERIFWLISFSLAIGFAAYYITNIYDKWKSSPVIISFSPFDAELSSIPFPAITICNMNQAKKNEAERILRDGSNVEKKLLDDACNGNATFDNTENINWTSLRDFLVKVGNSCSDILKSCHWGSNKIDCEEAFNNDLTDEGLCCSFNRLPPNTIFRNMKDISILNQTYPTNVYDWNAEKGFQDMDYEGYIPRRPLGAGAHLGLSVILDAQIDNYYCSSTRSTGFKVILSNPIETPKMADFGILISPGFETRVTIEPSVREATDALRDIPIEKRQCYFSNERPLQYYRHYSKNHCIMECHAQSSWLKCGCVPHFLPRNYSQKVCALDDKCMEKSKDVLDQQEGRSSNRKCFCLPSCYELSYELKRSKAPLRKFLNRTSPWLYTEKYIRENFGKVDFFFESVIYSKTAKRTIYDFTDLVASTGALLGVFTGFSFMSAAEFFFHIWLSWKNYREQRKKKMQQHEDHKWYTQKNCLQECQSNATLKRCSCVPYYLPRNNQTVYCGSIEVENCTQSAINDVGDLKNGSFMDGDCRCKPGCFELSYKHFMSESPILRSALSARIGYNISAHEARSMVVANFFFRHEISERQYKDLLYGFSEIMSNFGGIIGLCFGLSFLSVVEMVYFGFLRWSCAYGKNKRKIRKKRTKLRRKVKNIADKENAYPKVHVGNFHMAHI